MTDPTATVTLAYLCQIWPPPRNAPAAAALPPSLPSASPTVSFGVNDVADALVVVPTAAQTRSLSLSLSLRIVVGDIESD